MCICFVLTRDPVRIFLAQQKDSARMQSAHVFSRSFVARETIRPCLDVLKKKITMEFCEFEVINEVYLQNFLHRWVVNRETNLRMLINP